MTSRDFCYWLQGFFEIDDALPEAKREGLSKEQAEMIKKHLVLVFKHEIDPSYGDAKHQEDLNKIHNETKVKPSTPTYLGPTAYRC